MYRDLDCQELVREWKRLVNDQTKAMRDASLIKRFMETHSAKPPQVMLGFYQYVGIKTISIPQFLQQWETWYFEDEWEAELELAVCITHNAPPEYYVYHDLKDDFDNADDYFHLNEARAALSKWKERILA